MTHTNFNDLIAFLTVARNRSFTKAAARLGVSRSALSHSLRSLEARMGMQLLVRTTRNVAPTEAGERLMQSVGDRFDEIESELAALSALRTRPAGNIRLTATEFASSFALQPKLQPFLAQYPDINVEIVIDYGYTDIVEHRFDAGVRWGEAVAKDMVAVRIGPDMRMAVVSAPAYFTSHAPPRTPQELTGHNCINMRLPTYGQIQPWELEKGKRKLNVRVDGQLVVNSATQLLAAALNGLGLAFLPEEMIREHIDGGRLVQVLADWCPLSTGYHLYYPSRRQPKPAFALLVDALRYRAP